MDYSLLIIKREGQANPERGFAEVPSAANPNEIYNFGIIDYLEPWNLKRKAERAFKTMITD